MSRKIIKKRIIKVIIRDLKLNLREDEIQKTKRLDKLLGMDSVDIIELIISLEKEFEIKIPPEYLAIKIFNDLDVLAEVIGGIIQRKKK